MYNNYEAYSRDVLGYKNNNNCQNTYDNKFEFQEENYRDDTNKIEAFYPEIYKIINPMVESTYNLYSERNVDDNLLEEMTDRIYDAIENDEKYNELRNKPLKNGDVINPNAKEENRNKNFLLRDIVKILLIKHILKDTQKPYFPHRPPMPPRPRFNEEYYNDYYDFNNYKYRQF